MIHIKLVPLPNCERPRLLDAMALPHNATLQRSEDSCSVVTEDSSVIPMSSIDKQRQKRRLRPTRSATKQLRANRIDLS